MATAAAVRRVRARSGRHVGGEREDQSGARPSSQPNAEADGGAVNADHHAPPVRIGARRHRQGLPASDARGGAIATTCDPAVARIRRGPRYRYGWCPPHRAKAPGDWCPRRSLVEQPWKNGGHAGNCLPITGPENLMRSHVESDQHYFAHLLPAPAAAHSTPSTGTGRAVSAGRRWPTWRPASSPGARSGAGPGPWCSTIAAAPTGRSPAKRSCVRCRTVTPCCRHHHRHERRAVAAQAAALRSGDRLHAGDPGGQVQFFLFVHRACRRATSRNSPSTCAIRQDQLRHRQRHQRVSPLRSWRARVAGRMGTSLTRRMRRLARIFAGRAGDDRHTWHRHAAGEGGRLRVLATAVQPQPAVARHTHRDRSGTRGLDHHAPGGNLRPPCLPRDIVDRPAAAMKKVVAGQTEVRQALDRSIAFELASSTPEEMAALNRGRWRSGGAPCWRPASSAPMPGVRRLTACMGGGGLQSPRAAYELRRSRAKCRPRVNDNRTHEETSGIDVGGFHRSYPWSMRGSGEVRLPRFRPRWTTRPSA